MLRVSEQSGADQTRIGDRDRDEAGAHLREHLVEGRIDQVEYDDRLSAVLSARCQSDLEAPFANLPEPRPANAPGEVERPEPTGLQHRSEPGSKIPGSFAVAGWTLWPIMIGLITFLGWDDFWFLVFVPIAATTIAEYLRRSGASTGETGAGQDSAGEIESE